MLQNYLDEWLWKYNESRPHSGKYYYGKTPMQTFQDSLPLAKETSETNVRKITNTTDLWKGKSRLLEVRS